MEIKRSTKWMFWLGIILSYVVMSYIVLLFFFGTIYTLPIELFVPVVAPFIIAIMAVLFTLDLEDKLNEDPRAGGKILACGVAEFIAAFWVIYLIVWLGIQNLLAFLPMYLFVMTILVPNMVLLFLIGGLYFTVGYRLRFAPISSEPVPPLPNRNRIIALLVSGFLCILIAFVIMPYTITYVFIEILFYVWITLLLTGFVLGMAGAFLHDYSSKNRYDHILMHEIPEAIFVCPLCHTAIKANSFRCNKCYHLIPDSNRTF
ncbi:MAG: hypothetical protein ACFFAL_06510 [Promethearchaeota archaeon]